MVKKESLGRNCANIICPGFASSHLNCNSLKTSFWHRVKIWWERNMKTWLCDRFSRNHEISRRRENLLPYIIGIFAMLRYLQLICAILTASTLSRCLMNLQELEIFFAKKTPVMKFHRIHLDRLPQVNTLVSHLWNLGSHQWTKTNIEAAYYSTFLLFPS